MVKVSDKELQRAAHEGMDEFLSVFVEAIRREVGDQLTVENMQQLNTDQLTLLAWQTLHDEVMEGGFVQLIYNGYGPYVFKNPLAKVLGLWGLRELSKLVYSAHTLWLKHRDIIERDLSDEEFMALFEQFPDFDDLDDQFIEHEEEWTEMIARYVDDHIDRFAQVV